MNTFGSRRFQWAVLFPLLAASPSESVRADDFQWQGVCNERWHGCCPAGDDWYNNWFSSPIDGPCPGAVPQPGDNVFLMNSTVRLDQAAHVENLSTSGPFYLVAGLAIGHLWVDADALFDAVFYFDDGVVSSTGAGRFEVNQLVEFRTGAAKTLSLTTMNINPFARASVTEACEIRLDLADLAIWPSGTFEIRADASLVNNPGGMGDNHLINAGHLLKDASAGVSRIEVPLSNFGVVDVRTGTLRLDAGDGMSSGAFIIEPGGVLEIAAHTFGPGATVVSDGTDGFVRVPAAGVFEIAGGAAPSIPNFWMAPGSHVRGTGELTVTSSFLWYGGFFEATGAVRLAGSTGITGGAEKGAVDCRILNSGHITWHDEGNLILAWAVFENSGIFEVETDADMVGGTVTNTGVFVKAAGVGDTSVAILNNAGRLEARAGRLQIDRLVQTDGETLLNGGNVACVGPAELLGGALGGAGDVAGSVNNVAATVQPGRTLGTLSITGPYAQGAAGACEIELAGTTAGLEYDRLEIGGRVTLDGALVVRLVDGYEPMPGDRFEILTYAGRDGQFSSFSIPDRRPAWTLLLEVGDAAVSIFTALPGDVEGDGEIGLTDLSLLLAHFGMTSAARYSEGDLDGDGDIDLGDLTVLLARFGTHY
ncbi:MAG: hypothetical protein IT450_09620 [Phycisphaerales bacterium]|nr:hypothetical protein [Phycisphaerales bacterium]